MHARRDPPAPAPSHRGRCGSGVLMPDSAPIDILLDILELIERIERQTAGLTREGFLQDPDVQDATAYRLLAIGEAAKGLDNDPSRQQAPHPDPLPAGGERG